MFARHKLIQEFNFKPARNLLLTGGARYSKYASGTNVKALSAGGTFYFKPGFVTYRFTRYDTSGLGNSSAHLVTMRLKDPFGSNGSTQLWLDRAARSSSRISSLWASSENTAASTFAASSQLPAGLP